ncbi:TnpV protein [[Clostridium] innocuum]|nr:TnpV protein [Absiella sp. AM27-20]MCR0158305.1 TnpV protein [[Clostridium] innocuum]
MQNGEYQIPNLTLKQEEEVTIGKYGMMRKRYLKEHRPILFTNYLTTQTLNQHLLEIDQTANQRKALMSEQMMKQMGVNEELKAANQMEWIRLMNNIEETIQEIICKELIYN